MEQKQDQNLSSRLHCKRLPCKKVGRLYQPIEKLETLGFFGLGIVLKLGSEMQGFHPLLKVILEQWQLN